MAFLCGCTLAACHDDDDAPPSNTEDQRETELLQIHDYILNQFCEVDSTSGKPAYTPRIGEALPGTSGTTLSVAVGSEGEALQLFNNYFIPTDAENLIVRNGGVISIDMGKNGSVAYTPGGASSTTIATASINLPELPEVKQIEFIPKSLWPYNASSPFFPGDVVRDDNGWWWICVRACEGGIKGILMTWDGGYKLTIKVDPRKSYYNVLGCATTDAWNALAYFYYSDVNYFKTEVEGLAKAYGWSGCGKLLSGNSPIRHLYHRFQDYTHQVGDMSNNQYQSNQEMLWEAKVWYVNLNVEIDPKTHMPFFKTECRSFKEKEVWLPDYQNSHCITFTPWDDTSKYTIMYPIN